MSELTDLRSQLSLPTRSPVLSGSEAALAQLRADIVRLEAELDEVRRRTAEVELGGVDQDAPPTSPRSVQLLDSLAATTIAQERASMRQVLEGVRAVCEARLDEARDAARVLLEAARADLDRAVRERAALVEEAIAASPVGVDTDEACRCWWDEEDLSCSRTPRWLAHVAVADDSNVMGDDATAAPEDDPGVAGAAVATEVPVSSAGSRASVRSLLRWIVGGVLVVVGLALAVVVVLVLLH
jgi:hypothetical protein